MENMITMPREKIMEIVMGIQVSLISWMNFDYMKNGGKKAFLRIQTINIVHPNAENMIMAPIRNRMEIIMSIKVCLIP